MKLLQIILSYGMGVESTAILLRWIFDATVRPCPLDELLVVTAQVGDEYPDTERDVNAHIVPLMRQHGIRWAQVARAGASLTNGVVTLEDSHQPTRAFVEGAFKLSDEMRRNGTVPAYTGVHTCALKHKAEPIERWLNAHFRNQPGRHAFGYNSDETARVAKSEYAIAQREEKMAFGFNADEQDRAGRGSEYDTMTREAFYPLIEWGWTRQDCIDYIREKTGVTWAKSACVFCPFNALCDDAVTRHLQYPERVADALHMEHMALVLNPRSALYSKAALIDISLEKNPQAVAKFETVKAKQQWSVYRTRRMYSAPGKAERCIERLGAVENEAAARTWLTKIAWAVDANVEEHRGIAYAYRTRREEDVYPAREETYSVGPATVPTKAPWADKMGDARAMARYDKRWSVVVPGVPVAKKKRKSKAKVKKVAA